MGVNTFFFQRIGAWVGRDVGIIYRALEFARHYGLLSNFDLDWNMIDSFLGKQYIIAVVSSYSLCGGEVVKLWYFSLSFEVNQYCHANSHPEQIHARVKVIGVFYHSVLHFHL